MSTTSPLCLEELHQILTDTQLSALPNSAIQLLEISQDSENGIAEFAQPIEGDPGLTSQVLRFVNSSYFGFSQTISSVKMAINLVGMRAIKNFALWNAVFSLMPNPKSGPFRLHTLWQDSLRRALFARRIGLLLGLKDAEEVFAGALLQDMAIPMLVSALPKEYTEILESVRENGYRLSELERVRFGWDHGIAAGITGRSWNLPENLVHLIESHINVSFDIDKDLEPEERAMALSALLPTVANDLWPEFEIFCENYNRFVPTGSPTTRDLLDEIDAEFVEFAPMMKVGAPSMTLVMYYDQTEKTLSKNSASDAELTKPQPSTIQ